MRTSEGAHAHAFPRTSLLSATLVSAIARKNATLTAISASVSAKLNKTMASAALPTKNWTMVDPMPTKVNLTDKYAAVASIVNQTKQPKAYVSMFNKTMLNITIPKKNLSVLAPAMTAKKNLTYLLPKPVNLTAALVAKPAYNLTAALAAKVAAVNSTKAALMSGTKMG